jgi:hypothetical protein
VLLPEPDTPITIRAHGSLLDSSFTKFSPKSAANLKFVIGIAAGS